MGLTRTIFGLIGGLGAVTIAAVSFSTSVSVRYLETFPTFGLDKLFAVTLLALSIVILSSEK